MGIDIGTKIRQGEAEYEILSLLSQGGFGRAFLAKRTKPDSLNVVIKIPQPNVLADPVWSKKFVREARILANICHPNVVSIIAYIQFKSGEKALIQELVEDAQPLDAY